jgi:hypothetical protein
LTTAIKNGSERLAILPKSKCNGFGAGDFGELLPEGRLMSKIIVSYRRSDSQAVAGRIVDRLIDHFGPDSVFMDIDNIPFGIDFRDHIQSALSKAAVLIAIVGSDWLGVSSDQHRRIDDEDDPVRVELDTALRQKLLVVPVLVNNASMPKASTLPDALRAFAYLNAAPVDVGRDFRPNVDRLIQSIELVLANRRDGSGRGEAAQTSSLRANSSLILLATAVLLVIVAGAGWRFGPWSPKVVSTAPSAILTPPSQPPAAVANAVGTNPLGPATAEPPPAAVAAAPPIAPPSASPAMDDDGDWSAAQKANSYKAYQAYEKEHPQGRHFAEARRAAITSALAAEPPIGKLPTGETVLVDDHICDANQIKAVTGGDVTKGISRTKKCVSREDPL